VLFVCTTNDEDRLVDGVYKTGSGWVVEGRLGTVISRCPSDGRGWSDFDGVRSSAFGVSGMVSSNTGANSRDPINNGLIEVSAPTTQRTGINLMVKDE